MIIHAQQIAKPCGNSQQNCIQLHTVKFIVLLIPFALLGLFAGMKCSSRMDETLVRKITSVLLVLSGISLILKNL